MTGRWADTTPAQMREWMAGAAFPWWIAGGWALELWLGRPMRVHSDIEIGCFREDLPALVSHFAGWEIAIARQKQLTPFSGVPSLPQPPYSLWVRRGSEVWDFEVLIEDGVDDQWHYRRDPRVTLPVSALTLMTASGHRVVAPEVQLLFKSKERRSKDEDDFAAARSTLPEPSRRWLRDALTTVDPAHDWIAALAS